MRKISRTHHINMYVCVKYIMYVCIHKYVCKTKKELTLKITDLGYFF